jgi:hypothetical protein
LGHSKIWETFLKNLGKILTLPDRKFWKKESFLKVFLGKHQNGDDGRSFYKRALRISVRQTNLIPCNHITLKWDGA